MSSFFAAFKYFREKRVHFSLLLNILTKNRFIFCHFWIFPRKIKYFLLGLDYSDKK
jgi:hypothetical protein